MMRTMFRLICVVILFVGMRANAQSNIPLGSWRLHLSYNNVRLVEVTPSKIFAATESGILVFHRQDQSLATINKLNGLSSSGITSLGYHAQSDQLLVGYEEGDLDIIQSNDIRNFSRLRNADVTTSKKINHISTHGNLAYLSTAYGVVVFDLQQLEIKETWRDIGQDGSGVPVYQSAFLNDSIYLATDQGVLAGFIGDNLLDFNSWERFDQGDLSGSISSIATFGGKIYSAGPTGVYRLASDAWIKEAFADTVAIDALSSSTENLFMIINAGIWKMNTTGEISPLSDALVNAPAAVEQDDTGNFWIADQVAGLVSDAGGNFASFLPNGPSLTNVHRMVYAREKLYVVGGGYSPAAQPLNLPGELNIFDKGNWTVVNVPARDLTDIAFHGSSTYLASYGDGLLVTDVSGNTTPLDETNSPLVHLDADKSNIVALASSAHGLWVANYGGSQALHLLRADGTWESFSFGYPNEQHPTALAVDGDGRVWMVLNPSSGGGLIVFDRAANKAYFKSDAAGAGALPDKKMYSVATDRNGYVWIGTNAGVAYFFSADGEAMMPIFENRFLLRDEKITAVEVDGGNRKWIGTERGAWLFGESGETLVHHFTVTNSPLPSDIIHDIEIDGISGEVFFATDKGIISYRGDAITAGPDFNHVRIFPNPVSPGFSGTVGISGLSENAFVKITDISGRLVWQTQANGGMATWNVRKAATGVYLVFATSEDGKESVVGKIAVIE